MTYPIECTIVGIDFKHQALQGGRSSVKFHNYTHGLAPINVRQSNDIVCDMEESYTTEYRECISVDHDKYIVWTPELEQYIGKPLAHIKQLEVNVQRLENVTYNLRKDVKSHSDREDFWWTQCGNKEVLIIKLKNEKHEMFRAGLWAAVVASVSIIGNMYLWSTYVS